LTACEEVLEHRPDVRVHLYGGLRQVHDVPYPDRLQDLCHNSRFDLTIVASQADDKPNNNSVPSFLQDAIDKAATVRKLFNTTTTTTTTTADSSLPILPEDDGEPQSLHHKTKAKKKLYVQHILGLDWSHGRLKTVLPSEMVVVIAGRYELLTEGRSILQNVAADFKNCDDNNASECMRSNVFLNI
jgi:hypothetical protein